jgi:hypothetical protein
VDNEKKNMNQRQSVDQQAALEREAELNSPHPQELSSKSGKNNGSAETYHDSKLKDNENDDHIKLNAEHNENGSISSNHDEAADGVNSSSLDSANEVDAHNSPARSNDVKTLSPMIPTGSPVLFHPLLPIDERANSSPALHSIQQEQFNASLTMSRSLINGSHISTTQSEFPSNTAATSQFITFQSTAQARQPTQSVSPVASSHNTTMNGNVDSNNNTIALHGHGHGQQTSPAVTEGLLYQSVQRDQIFTGIVAMRDQPKIEVRSLVENLHHAGRMQHHIIHDIIISIKRHYTSTYTSMLYCIVLYCTVYTHRQWH